MRQLARITLLVSFLLFSLSRSTQAAEIKARWLGQDRQDHSGAIASSIQPNGVQDIHIALSGLPPKRQVVFAEITGHGADAWQFGGVQNQFGAVLLRKPDATTADLFFEPHHAETGREFCVKLQFDDASTINVYLSGGKADPNLRMPEAAMTAAWAGQQSQDHAGPGPSVGPDLLQDARINLAKLIPKDKIVAIHLKDPAGPAWSFGTNLEGHHNAEFERPESAPSTGSLFFQPDRDLNHHKLTITVTYENGKTDSSTLTCGPSNPRLPMPSATLPRITSMALKSRWLGQDGANPTSPGDVHLAISGLSSSRSIVAAFLSDSLRGVWFDRKDDRLPLDIEAFALPLQFRLNPNRTAADLFFPPVRDESNTPLTLRLVHPNGDLSFATIPGGPCDPFKTAPSPKKTKITARPGDDLNQFAQKYGEIRLSPGTYLLNKPLILPNPITLSADPGAILSFTQPADSPPWTAAIKIHSGGTTLRGFSVRFPSPIRWRDEVSWSPAVIGTTDNLDSTPNLPKAALVFENLDLESPPVSGKKKWEEPAKILRAQNATSGRFTRNTLRGGVIELFDGPWLVENNNYHGTPPDTSSQSVFVVHDPHDLVFRNNKSIDIGPSGKTWRFLALTNRGAFDRIENNVIHDVGPRDSDIIPGSNAPETILTESYHLFFEGKPAAVSIDRRIVKIPSLPGPPARTGDVLSILSGPSAGQWRKIAQRIEPTVYLLDSPLPPAADVISLSPGLINEVFSNNQIDAPGGSETIGFVLAGNLFNAQVKNNHVKGAGHAFQLFAFPSESPRIWGWSHAPFLGVLFEGNTIEDSLHGALLGVYHSPHIKSNKNRVYMTATVKNNIVRWSEPFLTRLSKTSVKRPEAGIILGFTPSLDPSEFVVKVAGNRLAAPSLASPPKALKVNVALMNELPITAQSFPLASGSPSPSLAPTSEPPPRR